MSYFNKWLRGTSQSYDPRRNRSKSLDVEALEISGIRLVMKNVRLGDIGGLNEMRDLLIIHCFPF